MSLRALRKFSFVYCGEEACDLCDDGIFGYELWVVADAMTPFPVCFSDQSASERKTLMRLLNLSTVIISEPVYLMHRSRLFCCIS